jgi:cell division protein FtsB
MSNKGDVTWASYDALKRENRQQSEVIKLLVEGLEGIIEDARTFADQQYIERQARSILNSEQLKKWRKNEYK